MRRLSGAEMEISGTLVPLRARPGWTPAAPESRFGVKAREELAA